MRRKVENMPLRGIPSEEVGLAHAIAQNLNLFRDAVIAWSIRKGFTEKCPLPGCLAQTGAGNPDCEHCRGTGAFVDPAKLSEKLLHINGEVQEIFELTRRWRLDELLDHIEPTALITAPDKHLPHRRAIEVEAADILIRVLHLAGWLGLDIGGAAVEKHAFNETRPFRHNRLH